MTQTESEIPTVEKHARLTGDTRTSLGGRMAALYDGQGMSIREIGERTGRSYGAARQMLVEAGVSLRPRGGKGKA